MGRICILLFVTFNFILKNQFLLDEEKEKKFILREERAKERERGKRDREREREGDRERETNLTPMTIRHKFGFPLLNFESWESNSSKLCRLVKEKTNSPASAASWQT